MRLSLRDATLGPTHPVTAQSLNNLAEALRSEGQRERGRAAASPGDRDPPHAAGARSSRSRREPEQSGRAADRRAPVRRSAGAVRRGAGDPHQGAGRAALGRGRGAEQSRCPGLRARRPTPTAEQRHRDVLAIEEAVRSPGDPEIALALGNLGPGADGRRQGRRRPRHCSIARCRCGSPPSAPDRLETAQSRHALALALIELGQAERAQRTAARKVVSRARAPARADLARARAGAERSRPSSTAAPRRLRRGPAAAAAGGGDRGDQLRRRRARGSPSA